MAIFLIELIEQTVNSSIVMSADRSQNIHVIDRIIIKHIVVSTCEYY